jgi:imidazolonepropionase-like amidohydrolase
MRILFFLLLTASFARAQNNYTLLKADRLFDGEVMHTGWSILIHNNRIERVGIINDPPANAVVKPFANATILPGLIEGHAHLFLHPYNETSWNDQVLKESRAERTARAVNHAKATLLAGFTTVRDLGTEGAMYDDAGLKRAIEKGIIPGPRMIIASRAIVAKGTYGPKSENADVDLPQGAAEVASTEDMTNEVRTQLAKGADVIKIYADYRWGKNGESLPTFSVEMMALAASIANSGGRKLVVHASTVEGMRRAIMAGASTIEHGTDASIDILKLMREKNVALCPTLAAIESNSSYNGWRKNIDPEPARVQQAKKMFAAANKEGVTICMGGDVGVFAHGDNAKEMELMVEYGMKPLDVLRSATSVNADVFGYADTIGRLKVGMPADIVIVQGDPSVEISDVRKVLLVMKDGVVYNGN